MIDLGGRTKPNRMMPVPALMLISKARFGDSMGASVRERA